MSNRRVISRHLFFGQTSWSSRSVWRKQWLWKAFHLAFFKFADCKGWCLNWPAGRWRLEQTSRAFSHWECVVGPWPVVDFSGGKSELKTRALDGSFDLPTQIEILESIINFVDSARDRVNVTTLKETQDLLAKAILCVNLNLIYILTLA